MTTSQELRDIGERYSKTPDGRAQVLRLDFAGLLLRRGGQEALAKRLGMCRGEGSDFENILSADLDLKLSDIGRILSKLDINARIVEGE